jgi:hypothetical protein
MGNLTSLFHRGYYANRLAHEANEKRVAVYHDFAVFFVESVGYLDEVLQNPIIRPPAW